LEEGGEKEKYEERKRKYKELCERKRREENERFEREAEKVRNESEVWRVINRERKHRKGVNKDIGMEEWRKYFKEVLGGMERRVRKKNEEGRRRKEEKEEGMREEEVGWKEFTDIIDGVKEGKVAGSNGIQNRYREGLKHRADMQ